MIILIPMPIFLQSQLPVKRKAVLCGVFGLGAFTVSWKTGAALLGCLVSLCIIQSMARSSGAYIWLKLDSVRYSQQILQLQRTAWLPLDLLVRPRIFHGSDHGQPAVYLDTTASSIQPQVLCRFFSQALNKPLDTFPVQIQSPSSFRGEGPTARHPSSAG